MDQEKNAAPQESADQPVSIIATTRARPHALARLLKRCAILVVVLLVVAWAVAPSLRAFTLVANVSHRSAPSVPKDLPVQNIHF